MVTGVDSKSTAISRAGSNPAGDVFIQSIFTESCKFMLLTSRHTQAVTGTD